LVTQRTTGTTGTTAKTANSSTGSSSKVDRASSAPASSAPAIATARKSASTIKPTGRAVAKVAPTPVRSSVPIRTSTRRTSTAQPSENITFSVDLPPTVHTIPDHEVALTIHDVAIDPGLVDATQPGTTSIPLSVVATIAVPVTMDAAADSKPTAVVPLPSSDDGVYTPSRKSRRGRPAVSSTTPETASMLTAERLVNGKKRRKPAPEGFWPELVYGASLHLINPGDSLRVRERKALDARIAKQFEGGARFIPVLTRKGGVGKTTVTTLLGMALASVRDDRVIAIDANPDRGTLAERISHPNGSTVRDVVRRAKELNSVTDFTALVSRDETRLDVLASDTDPMLAQAFDESDYNIVADQAAKFYSVVLTDCGTGIVHSVMKATLQRADSIVIVSGGSVDEARLASETLTWLESNGYGHLAKNAIVALNTATQATKLIKLDEIEAHFQSRVRDVVAIPYDPHLAEGSVVHYRDLQKITRVAARDLAALVMDGIPEHRPQNY
jgi:MinD-like ATPase involved in chromosome partitioning or flagellar assembly